MKIRPLHNQLVIQKEEAVKQSASGIFIAGEIDKTCTATVLAVGPGIYSAKGERITIDIPVGARIVMRAKAGEIFKVDGEEFTVIRDTDVYGVIND